jgi:hypothetical protein
MDVIQTLIARIEERRKETKIPCKSYSTHAKATKAVSEAAARAGKYFDSRGIPARYVVFFCPGFDRWVGAMDYTELLSRKTCTGGYLGAVQGFYTY